MSNIDWRIIYQENFKFKSKIYFKRNITFLSQSHIMIYISPELKKHK